MVGPADSRAAQHKSLDPGTLTDDLLSRIRNLDAIARERGQSLAQLALAWALRDPRMTSLVIGASRVEQLHDNLTALNDLAFDEAELARIDEHAVEAGINLWARSSAG